jgi:hypothetical protein
MDDLLRYQIESVNSAISKIIGLYSDWAKLYGLNYNSLMVLYTMDYNPNLKPKKRHNYNISVPF